MGLPTQPTSSAPEMRRLPTLLRVLAAARPLSSVPAFGALESNTDDHEDELLNEAVRRLESRAAIYSVAEGVEVTACHLAPAVCRKVSKLKPLRTMTREAEDLLLARPNNAGDMEVDDEHDDSLSGEEDVEQPSKGPAKNRSCQRRSSVDPRLAIKTQGEDSQEANVVRILAELSSLVVQSLKPPKKDDDELIDWSISVEESILAEPGSKVDKNVGGAMVSSDLGATVVSLMHHAAVLRHDHVAVSAMQVRSWCVPSRNPNCVFNLVRTLSSCCPSNPKLDRPYGSKCSCGYTDISTRLYSGLRKGFAVEIQKSCHRILSSAVHSIVSFFVTSRS